VSRRRLWAFAVLLLASFCGRAGADGPHVVFRGSADAYEVTLFAAPAPLGAGEAGFAVLVEDAKALTPVRAARVQGSLTSPGGKAVPLSFAPSLDALGLHLPGARIVLPSAGAYAMELTVSQPGEVPSHLRGTLQVEPNHSRRTTVWVGVLFPLLVIALFLLNQVAKTGVARREA
jgi:hypothetical protein